ncbi:sec-independent protein translocase protein TatB [Phyllobacterium trifolii]|jgi:sec-independent protein translocase protein TatB|uniref:Sec-independent protein translocase protein TatB n=1 Tax=Phyllobacterium trifolii TaxID=300193 RepID=A0A839UCJ8_9HYPH|nr:Sec-independent protein translocase protein TatB [Phyllobacterium trifolii]MBB3147573.1 sec-independent protein translocase protein TatB [Phyllobacterium trifolii]
MFEVGWSEILVIVIVMIVVVGPKDLPKMLRAFGKATAKFRATAGEFRKQFDEALKEAELDDVREIINDAKSLDPRNDIRKVFDPVRTIGEEIRSSLKDATATAKDNVAVPDPAAPGATQLQPQVMEPLAAPATPAAETAIKKPARSRQKPVAAAAETKAKPTAPAKKAADASQAVSKKSVAPAVEVATAAPTKTPAKRTAKPKAKAVDTGTKS